MRISIRPNDSGHAIQRHLRSHGQRALIKFNGVSQVGAITADSEAGMLVRYVNPMVFDAERQCMVDEVVHGRVEIEIVDEAVL
jgi:hypothetical protein